MRDVSNRLYLKLLQHIIDIADLLLIVIPLALVVEIENIQLFIVFGIDLIILRDLWPFRNLVSIMI